MSAEDALKRYYEKQMASEKRMQKPRQKNGQPEKAVEKSVMEWAKSNNIFLHVVEAKAVYSPAAGQYLRGQSESGFPDIVGNYKSVAVWIELKAPKKRGTLKPHQREFLTNKILQGCFACCVDSVELLQQTLDGFFKLDSQTERADFLIRALPTKRRRRETVTTNGDGFDF